MPFPRRFLLTVALLAALAISASGQQTGTPPILPDAKLTPGDTLEVSLNDIRQSGYSSRVRNVPISVKREVYAAYGIERWGKGEYEIDHLVPLCIGGSNSKKNLWPESCLTAPWNAKVKNRLERRLLSLVRKGTLDLHTAQHDIASNWIEAYQKYVDPSARETGPVAAPAPAPVAEKPDVEQAAEDRSMVPDEALDTETSAESASVAAVDASASPAPTISEQVWVNTKSHVIWKPGGAWYGKTEHGKYMSAAEAEAAGNHYAYGRGY